MSSEKKPRKRKGEVPKTKLGSSQNVNWYTAPDVGANVAPADKATAKAESVVPTVSTTEHAESLMGLIYGNVSKGAEKGISDRNELYHGREMADEVIEIPNLEDTMDLLLYEESKELDEGNYAFTPKTVILFRDHADECNVDWFKWFEEKGLLRQTELGPIVPFSALQPKLRNYGIHGYEPGVFIKDYRMLIEKYVLPGATREQISQMYNLSVWATVLKDRFSVDDKMREMRLQNDALKQEKADLEKRNNELFGKAEGLEQKLGEANAQIASKSTAYEDLRSALENASRGTDELYDKCVSLAVYLCDFAGKHGLDIGEMPAVDKTNGKLEDHVPVLSGRMKEVMGYVRKGVDRVQAYLNDTEAYAEDVASFTRELGNILTRRNEDNG